MPIVLLLSTVAAAPKGTTRRMFTTTSGQLGAAALAGAFCALSATWMLKRRGASYRGAPYTLSEAPLEGIISYHHMYVDSDGNTRIKRDCSFGELVKKGYAGTPQYVRDFKGAFDVKTVVVTQQFGPNPWHYCPSPQFVVTLSGQWYIETGDGDVIVMSPGDVLYQVTRRHCRLHASGLTRGCIGACVCHRTTPRTTLSLARARVRRSTTAASSRTRGHAISSSSRWTPCQRPRTLAFGRKRAERNSCTAFPTAGVLTAVMKWFIQFPSMATRRVKVTWGPNQREVQLFALLLVRKRRTDLQDPGPAGAVRSLCPCKSARGRRRSGSLPRRGPTRPSVHEQSHRLCRRRSTTSGAQRRPTRQPVSAGAGSQAASRRYSASRRRPARSALR